MTKLRIVLTGNTCFKIANFRAGLLQALLAQNIKVIVLAPRDDCTPKLESMGIEFHDLLMDRNGTSPLAEMALLRRIYRFMRRERPDTVFSYTIKNNIYAGLACRRLGIPFIPNVTGLGPAFNDAGVLNHIIRLLYQQAFARASAVFFQNPEDRGEFLRARLVSAARARLLPGSGVDLQAFRAAPLPSDESGPIFLMVSRILWDKGVGLFVEAAQHLRKIYPQAQFQLLGPIDENSRSAIPRAQIEDWHKEGAITYLGETQDVRPALTEAHCIVLPTWYREGTPRILLEAAATARPVITTNIPGCRDAVEADVTGWLCRPQDVDALTEAMREFLNMPHSQRAAMGRSARARAEAAFDEEIVIQAYLDHLPSATREDR